MAQQILLYAAVLHPDIARVDEIPIICNLFNWVHSASSLAHTRQTYKLRISSMRLIKGGGGLSFLLNTNIINT